MLKKLRLSGFVVILFALSSDVLFAQNSFLAVASGNWNGSGVWSTDGVTPLVCGPCVAGTHYPSAIDQGYTQGFNISLPANNSFSVRDLYLAFDVPLGLTRPNLGLAPTLTISGELAGYDPDIFDYAVPTTNVIRNDNSTINLVFDGAAAGGPVINSWSTAAPLKVVRFNPALSTTTLDIQTIAIANNGQLTVLNGTLQLLGTVQAATGATSATITVNSGTTLRVNTGNINGDGTANSLFPSILVNGTLTSVANTTSYINCSSMTLAAGATLNVGFNGTDQTQGWWYQSNSPGTNSLDATSTVNYNSSSAQNVAAGITYGNLSMTAGALPILKTLSGSGLIIQGNLAVGSNVTSSPSSLVEFSGTAAQSISGAGTLNFDGGLSINKASGTLTLNKAITISGGVNVASGGTFNLGDVTTTLAGGGFANAGTTTSGTSGTLTVTGSSTFSGAGSLTLNNLDISGTGAASINNSSWSVTGNISNSGSITLPTSSTITFTGGSAQSISGNAFTIGNMVVNKALSSILSNNSSVTLLGALTMTDGIFDADGTVSGNFILNSNSGGDARIGTISAGGSIVGELTFQRYFDNTVLGQPSQWRNFAFPVTSVDYSELAASVTLQPNSLATYTESTAGDIDQGWIYPASGTLNSTLGHTAWMYNSTPTTVSVRGPLLNGLPNTYNYGVGFTNNSDPVADGWNFIPNPYASPIDWNSSSGWLKTNVGGVAAIWDQVGQTYQYSSGSFVIAQGQGFWVQTSAGPLLTSTEAVKFNDSNPTFYRTASDDNSKVIVSLKSDRDKDVTTIQFRKDATDEHDLQFDAYKLKNKIYNLSSLTSKGASLAVNALPRTRCGSSIKLYITDIKPGIYSMSVTGLESFDNLQSITLTDRFTETSRVVKADEEYSFEVTSDPNSFGAERFQLEFEFTDQEPNPVIAKEENRLTSSSLEGNQWYLNDTPIDGATGRTFVPKVHGDYHVRVQDGRCNLKSEIIAVNDGLNRIYPNPASEWLKVDVFHLAAEGTSGRILVHTTQGQLVRDEAFGSRDTVKDIDILDVKPGSYIVTVVSGTGVILEKSKVVIK